MTPNCNQGGFSIEFSIVLILLSAHRLLFLTFLFSPPWSVKPSLILKQEASPVLVLFLDTHPPVLSLFPLTVFLSVLYSPGRLLFSLSAVR